MYGQGRLLLENSLVEAQKTTGKECELKQGSFAAAVAIVIVIVEVSGGGSVCVCVCVGKELLEMPNDNGSNW